MKNKSIAFRDEADPPKEPVYSVNQFFKDFNKNYRSK